jgi:hypothetical protein
MMRSLYWFVCLLGLFLSTPALSQRIQLFEGEYRNTPFEEFVKSLEQRSRYTFYYNSASLDTIKVEASFKNKNITDVLSQVFENTPFKFVVTTDNQVFITYEREVMADLPPGFFGDEEPRGREVVAFDFSEYEKRERQQRVAEAKLYSIGNKTTNLDGTATLIGTLREQSSGEPLIGASVFIEKPLTGTSTDQFGHYSLTIPKGRHELKIKSIGMKQTVRQVMLYSNGRLDIELEEEITPLKEVVVESERDARVAGVQMGMEKLDIRTMRQMPLALGETDIMKVVLALPGVQSVGEGTVGLNVRGGATNQNLILFNDAVVYNPSHLFGFFSTFNPDVLKNVELYKSGITADYGGRLSSVLDVHSREGNTKKFTGSGGISPVTGRLTIEGPLIKDKTSFILGVRSTYSNWLLRQLKNKSFNRSTASFYDVTANVSHKINDENQIYASAYMSNDQFQLNGDTSYRYSDRNASLKWKHVINNKLYGVLTGSYSNYFYSVSSEMNPFEAFMTEFDIKQMTGKLDLNFFPNARHTLNGGISVTRYEIAPGYTRPIGEESNQMIRNFEHEQGFESAAYIGENFEVNPRLSLYAGVRYSVYQYLGEKHICTYGAGSREKLNVTDTIHYGKGKTISSYHGLEPRLSVRYGLGTNASVKLSYNRMRQYIQMLSNTTAVTPTDIWKLSDNYIKPQIGDQYSIGFYKNLKGNLIETSIEGYYKTIISTIDYKDGAALLDNAGSLETEVIDADGKAYGVEVLLKKSTGKINGWVSYTYSRTFLRSTGENPSEVVNRGTFYPSSFDKPHAVNLITNYKFSRRFNVSWNVIYNTGRPITPPIAKYRIEGTERVLYGDRNSYRIPDYFRMDLSMNIEGNHKVRKLAHSSWTLAIYNVTGRANPYSVFFVTEGSQIKGYKLSIFARPIPTITYNFRF